MRWPAAWARSVLLPPRSRTGTSGEQAPFSHPQATHSGCGDGRGIQEAIGDGEPIGAVPVLRRCRVSHVAPSTLTTSLIRLLCIGVEDRSSRSFEASWPRSKSVRGWGSNA